MITESPIELIYQAHRLLNEIESTSRDYGGGRSLFSSEIHALSKIDEHPGVNLTGLADSLDVSKSAASKVVKKLMDSDFIVKRFADDNKKEVYFFVTAQGKLAVQGHSRFRERVFGPLFQREAKLEAKERASIVGFLSDLHTLLST